MARENKIWKIDSFHGGLNKVSSENDLDSTYSIKATNISFSDTGKIKMQGHFEPLDGIALPVDPYNIPSYSKGGYGLFTFESDYLILKEDGDIYADGMQYSSIPVIITIIPNNLYFHIRQQVGNEIIYKENAICMNMEGFNPIDPILNNMQLPASLYAPLMDFEVTEFDGLTAMLWNFSMTFIQNKYAYYHASKGIRISDGNYNNDSIKYLQAIDPTSDAQDIILNGHQRFGPLVRKLEIYKGDYFLIDFYLSDEEKIPGYSWRPSSFSGSGFMDAVYQYTSQSDVIDNPWYIPSEGGSPVEASGGGTPGAGEPSLSMTWEGDYSSEKCIRTMYNFVQSSGFYDQGPNVHWGDHHNCAYLDYPPSHPVTDQNENGVAFVSQLAPMAVSENLEFIDDVWGTNSTNEYLVSKLNDQNGEFPIIDDNLKYHYAWHFEQGETGFKYEINDAGEPQETLGSPPFRIGHMAYKPDAGDTDMDDFTNHCSVIAGFGTSLTGQGPYSNHSISTSSSGRHSMYVTIMGGAVRWWSPQWPTTRADAYSTKALFGCPSLNWENGGPLNAGNGNHWQGGGLYYYTAVNKFVPFTIDGVYSTSHTANNTGQAANWDRVREYSLAGGINIAEDPGLSHLGSICSFSLGERGEDITGFLSNSQNPLPPFPWYNIYLGDIDLQHAEHLSLYFFLGGQSTDRCRFSNWALDLADFRIDYTSYYPEYRFQPTPWDLTYIHPITTTSTDDPYNNDNYVIINNYSVWEDSDEAVNIVDIGTYDSSGAGNLITSLFDDFFPNNSRAHAPVFISYMIHETHFNTSNSIKNGSTPMFLKIAYGGEDEWYMPAVSNITCIPDTASYYDTNEDVYYTYNDMSQYDQNDINEAEAHYAEQKFHKINVGKWGYLQNNGVINSGSQRGYCFADVTDLKEKSMVKVYDYNFGMTQESISVNKGLEFRDSNDRQEYSDVYDPVEDALNTHKLEQHVLQIGFSGNQSTRQYINTNQFSNVDFTGNTQTTQDNWNNISYFMRESFLTGEEKINNQNEIIEDPEWSNIGNATFTISSTFLNADDFAVTEDQAWSLNPTMGLGIRWFFHDQAWSFPGDNVCAEWDLFEMLVVDISNNPNPENLEGTTHRIFRARSNNPPSSLSSPDYNVLDNDEGGEDILITNYLGTLEDYLQNNPAGPSTALPIYGAYPNQEGNDEAFNTFIGSDTSNLGVVKVQRGRNNTNIINFISPGLYTTYYNLLYTMGARTDVPEVKITWDNNSNYDLVGFIPHYGNLSFSGGFFFTNTLQSAYAARNAWQFWSQGADLDPYRAPQISPSIYFHILRLCSLNNLSTPCLEGPIAWAEQPNQGLAYQASFEAERNQQQGNLFPDNGDGFGVQEDYSWQIMGFESGKVHVDDIDRDGFSYDALIQMQENNYSFFTVLDETDIGGPANNLQSQDWCALPYNYTPFNVDNVNAGYGYYASGDFVNSSQGVIVNNETKVRAGRSWKWFSMVGVNLVFKEKNRNSGAVLSEDVSVTEHLIDVSDGSVFSENQYIRINSENMKITNISSNTLTVVRGVKQSPINVHYNGDNIRILGNRGNIISPIIPVEKDLERIGTNLSNSDVASKLNIDTDSIEDVLTMFGNECGHDIPSSNYFELWDNMDIWAIQAANNVNDPNIQEAPTALFNNVFRYSFHRYFHEIIRELFN